MAYTFESQKRETLRPAVSEINQNDRELRRLRVFLLVLMLVEAGALFAPRIYSHWHADYGFMPLVLIGFVFLALILTLHLSAQRKILCDLSSALSSASLYIDRLEQLSPIDPPTQLFNRRYLDELFNHQLKWLKRSGKMATLLLLEAYTDKEMGVAAEEAIVEAAFILRSNFRGSDYVVRYAPDQFLVVLPDTNEQQAQFALSRLTDKVHRWNLENESHAIGLRLVLTNCQPDANIWERLSVLENRIRNKNEAGIRKLVPSRQHAELAIVASSCDHEHACPSEDSCSKPAGQSCPVICNKGEIVEK